MSDSVKKYYESRTDDNWQWMPESKEKNNFSDVKLNHKPNKRKEYPMYSGLLKYFPNALREVSHCSWVGQQQHNPDKPLAWDRSKSGDELDAMLRHLTDHAKGIEFDEDGVRHIVKCCWRLLAITEKMLENEKETQT